MIKIFERVKNVRFQYYVTIIFTTNMILFSLFLVALWCRLPEINITYIIYIFIRKRFVETKSDDVSYPS